MDSSGRAGGGGTGNGGGGGKGSEEVRVSDRKSRGRGEASAGEAARQLRLQRHRRPSRWRQAARRPDEPGGRRSLGCVPLIPKLAEPCPPCSQTAQQHTTVHCIATQTRRSQAVPQHRPADMGTRRLPWGPVLASPVQPVRAQPGRALSPHPHKGWGQSTWPGSRHPFWLPAARPDLPQDKVHWPRGSSCCGVALATSC